MAYFFTAVLKKVEYVSQMYHGYSTVGKKNDMSFEHQKGEWKWVFAKVSLRNSLFN